MPRPRTAEFFLLLACCRWPLSAAALQAIEERSVGVDWARFVRLAARHRVDGIVWKALNAAGVDLPPGQRTALSTTAGQIARQNLALAVESIHLQRSLTDVGLSPLFVKGITLGKLAYGDIARKAGWDIDLLIAPDDLDQAAAVLRARGYTLQIPDDAEAPSGLRLWHRHAKESVWRNADETIWVELHTALTDSAMMLPGVDTMSPRQDVEVSPGMTLATLERDALFAYLCVHGAASAWFRLKWLADVAALLGDAPTQEVARLYHRARALGAGRATAQALLLVDMLFGPTLPDDFRQTLRASWVNRAMVAVALRKLTGRTGEVELDEVFLGTASIHLAHFGLVPGWRFKRSAIRRLLISPVDRVATPLPSVLSWVYPFLQLARLVRGQSHG